MSPERQRVVIAEACGWFFMDCHWHFPNGAKATADGGPDEPPNYPGDLNAMHEAIDIFDYEQAEKFDDELFGICTRENELAENPKPRRFAAINATAAQRAEAFLRTIGKWEGQS